MVLIMLNNNESLVKDQVSKKLMYKQVKKWKLNEKFIYIYIFFLILEKYITSIKHISFQTYIYALNSIKKKLECMCKCLWNHWGLHKK